MLEKISVFAKNNNISIPGLNYKFSNIIPNSFYDIVINYLMIANPKFKNKPKIENFYIKFDKNKNAYFEFVGNNEEKTRLVLISDGIHYDNLPPAKVIKENVFLENVKNLEHARNYQLLKILPENFKKRFMREEEIPFENDIDTLTQEIIHYITYLENEKIKSTEIDKLYFDEAESSSNMTKSPSDNPRNSVERKHEEIPFEERKTVLDNYSAEDTFEARSNNTSSIYYVKVFKVKEKCKLVMEPIEGNKYTKVVHLDSNEFSKGTLREIVIDSLQLSRSETTNTKEITRHSHTTLDEYKKLLEYLVNEQNNGISSTTKIRIDEASNLKR